MTRLSRGRNGSDGWPSIAMTIAAWRSSRRTTTRAWAALMSRRRSRSLARTARSGAGAPLATIWKGRAGLGRGSRRRRATRSRAARADLRRAWHAEGGPARHPGSPRFAFGMCHLAHHSETARSRRAHAGPGSHPPPSSPSPRRRAEGSSTLRPRRRRPARGGATRSRQRGASLIRTWRPGEAGQGAAMGLPGRTPVEKSATGAYFYRAPPVWCCYKPRRPAAGSASRRPSRAWRNW